MTLDEAIDHLRETLANEKHEWSCEECKSEHEQLLKWLVELKSYRIHDGFDGLYKIITGR